MFQNGKALSPIISSFLLTSLLASLLTSPTINTAVAQQARRDPTLRATLENAYNAWHNAIATRDVAKWEQVTAFSRQMEVRNIIVSQKLPFPKTFFAEPLEAPTLAGLVGLGVLSTRETATSTYFGKANFGGAPDGGPIDNLIVLHFLKEDGTWKFDRLRVVKTGNDSELLLQIRNADFSFLQGEEFQPAPQLPPVPQPVNAPDFIAEAWVDSTGYEVNVTVNGIENGNFSNVKTAELIMGGVRRGTNQINITTKPLAGGAAGGSPRVEIAIYAAKSPDEEAIRVFHYRPATPDAQITQTFAVE
ncbi:MAG: hypothetical protein VXX36_06510 [Verrucomicrobiota bacterium]|nr:hypothetical protein [Verrucomicrobiota bacterium]